MKATKQMSVLPESIVSLNVSHLLSEMKFQNQILINLRKKEHMGGYI